MGLLFFFIFFWVGGEGEGLNYCNDPNVMDRLLYVPMDAVGAGRLRTMGVSPTLPGVVN